MMTFLQAAEAVAVSEETRMGLWTLFTKGGWLMWPLLALGGVTIFIFVERFMAIRKASVLDMNFMNRIRDYISDGKISTAVNLCRKTDTPIARVIEKGRQVHCAVAPFRRRRRPDGTSGLAQGACALGARLRPHRHQRRYLLGCPHEQRIQGQAPLGVDHNAQRLPPGAAFQAAGKRGVIG